jgi:hypothetical protein
VEVTNFKQPQSLVTVGVFLNCRSIKMHLVTKTLTVASTGITSDEAIYTTFLARNNFLIDVL